MKSRIVVPLLSAIAVGGGLASIGPGCAGPRNAEVAAGTNPAPAAASSAPGATPGRSGLSATAGSQVPEFRLGDGVRPRRYRVELDLDPDKDEFAGSIAIDVTLAEATRTIWLHATDISVQNATFSAGGETWVVEVVPEDRADILGFDLARSVAPGEGTLVIDYRGLISARDNSGVFKQRDPGDRAGDPKAAPGVRPAARPEANNNDRWYVYTQFEPIAARRAFPCFDEPRFKVPWQLTIRTREGLLAVANTPEIGKTAGPDAGMTTYRFAATKPIPSYLVAFAVGAFETVDLGRIGRNRTPARIIVPRGRTDEARYAAEATPPLLVLLEDYFDMAYPYAKLDSIALPHHSGAMENPGLITYDQALLLSPPDQETRQFRRAYAGIAAHELAHQWFGNLVTLAWWDDIWLNEAFATWLAAKIRHQWQPGWDSDVTQAFVTEYAMETDSLISARQIRQPIASDHDILNVFDVITYQKGAAVLGMFERWIGAEAFRARIRAYVKQHAWDTTTASDFLSALATVNQPGIAKSFRTFLDQAGVPVVSLELLCNEGGDAAPAIGLAQERFLPVGSLGSTTDRIWEIPICVKYGMPGNPVTVHEQCTLLAAQTATMVLERTGQCPAWVLANAHAAGYYRVAYTRDMRAKLLGSGAAHLSTTERVRLVGDIEALVAAGKMEMGDALALVPALMQDGNEYLILDAATLVASLRRHLVAPALAPRYVRFVRQTFGPVARQLGWRPRPGESHRVGVLRRDVVALAAAEGQDPTLIRQAIGLTNTWLRTRQGIDPSMLESVLATAARHGNRALHERLTRTALTTEELTHRSVLLSALASVVNGEQVKRNLLLVTTGKLDIRETWPFWFWPLAHSETRAVVYEFVKEHYDTLVTLLPRESRALLLHTGGQFCDQGRYDDVKDFFSDKIEAILGGPRILDEVLEEIQLCMARRALQQPSVEAFLRSY